MDATPSSPAVAPATRPLLAAARATGVPSPLAPATPSTPSKTTVERKRWRPTTEDRDLALLRAAAALRPQHAPWGTIKKAWEKVAKRVVDEIGEGLEVTFLSCQHRYKTLVDRFLERRSRHKSWPPHPEMRALLEAAADDQKPQSKKESAKQTKPAWLPPKAILDQLDATVRATAQKTTRVKEENKDDESSEDGEVHEEKDDGQVEVEEEVDSSAAVQESMTGRRRSFVESTVVAVLDRLAVLEQTWLENEREEREWKRQRLTLEREAHTTNEGKSDSPTHPPPPNEQDVPPTENAELPTTSPKAPTPSHKEPTDPPTATTPRAPSPIPTLREPESLTTTSADEAIEKETVHSSEGRQEPKPQTDESTLREFEALQRTVAELSTTLTASTQEQLQLNQRVAQLAAALAGVGQEKDALKRDVAALRAVSHNAESLAGTLRSLQDTHRGHEASFAKFVHQQDARIDALEREVQERHRVMLAQLGPLKNAGRVDTGGDLSVASLQKERERLEKEHRERLARLEKEMTRLEAPVNELKMAVEKQQQRFKGNEVAVDAMARDQTKTATVLKELRAALEQERAERDKEYDTLLKTIERVVAGHAELR